MTLNLGGSLMDLACPRVMGIVNITPDSFYAQSRTLHGEELAARVNRLVAEGADILDVGGYSTRPGAEEVTAEEEFSRVARGLETIRREFPEMPVSVDTFRSEVARRCIDEFAVEIINDVGGGTLDPEIGDVVAEAGCAYVLMHMRGTPSTMTSLCDYPRGVVAEVLEDLARKADALQQKGVCDVIVDPGFGFAKTTAQNFELMRGLGEFHLLNLPLLVGISRKSMIYKTLGTTPESEETLAATTALNTMALMGGAHILRVHDVAQARAAIKIYMA